MASMIDHGFDGDRLRKKVYRSGSLSLVAVRCNEVPYTVETMTFAIPRSGILGIIIERPTVVSDLNGPIRAHGGT